MEDEAGDERRFLADEEVVVTAAEGEAAAEEEAKPKIDFEASWFDQTWSDAFTMQWTTKTEGAPYVPKPLTTRAPSSFW